MEELALSDVLERMHQLDEAIKEAGITKANIGKIRDLITEYDELEAALDAKRQKQFWDTAYDFLAEQKIAGNKNNAALALFLRRFAAHVVREMAHGLDLSVDIWEVVDHIPEMDTHESTEEE